MRGGTVLREARRRAGLTQVELAARLGTTQSAVARLERGVTEPSFARVVAGVRACGLEFVPQVRPVDNADWSVASGNLLLTVDQRVRKHRSALRFAQAGRRALLDARR
jgi:transcriptional regulator with XRE-family HTH domain